MPLEDWCEAHGGYLILFHESSYFVKRIQPNQRGGRIHDLYLCPSSKIVRVVPTLNPKPHSLRNKAEAQTTRQHPLPL